MRIKTKRRLIIAWCLLAVLACGLLAYVGSRILVKDDAGQKALDEFRRGMHSKGFYTDARFEYFTFKAMFNPGLAFDVDVYFVEDALYCVLPQGVDVTRLVPSYRSVEGEKLQCGGAPVQSGWTRLDASGGEIALQLGDTALCLKVRQTTQPVMNIETYEDAVILDRESYVPGEASLYAQDGAILQRVPASLRVRGNTTSQLPKLPYKMRSSVKTSLLGLPAADEWVLLANFMDPSMQRNIAAFDIAREAGMRYVPQMRYTELYVGGQYQGVYTLGTQVEVSAACVDLPPMALEDGAWQGSYLLEMDYRSVGLPECITTPMGVPLVVKQPALADDALREEILSEVARFEACLANDDLSVDGVHYSSYIDVESFAAFYVVNEFTWNGDATLPASVYLYRDADGRLAMGPVWDFDLAFGNTSGASTETLVLQNAFWFARLTQDETFCRLVLEKYRQLSPYLEALPNEVRQRAGALGEAAGSNFIITYIGVNAYSNLPSDDPYAQEVEALASWIEARKAWLDVNLEAMLGIE